VNLLDLRCGAGFRRRLRIPLPEDVQSGADRKNHHEGCQRAERTRGRRAPEAPVHGGHADRLTLELSFARQLITGAGDAVEFGLQFGGVDSQGIRELADEAAGEKRSGQAVPLVRLNGFEQAGVDFRGFGDLLDSEAQSQAFLTEFIPDGVHK